MEPIPAPPPTPEKQVPTFIQEKAIRLPSGDHEAFRQYDHFGSLVTCRKPEPSFLIVRVAVASSNAICAPLGDHAGNSLNAGHSRPDTVRLTSPVPSTLAVCIATFGRSLPPAESSTITKKAILVPSGDQATGPAPCWNIRWWWSGYCDCSPIMRPRCARNKRLQVSQKVRIASVPIHYRQFDGVMQGFMRRRLIH
jgi:hypothetical protein